MPEIVLTTLNARYIHCAFGLRYLLANMGELQCQTSLLEFTIAQPTLEILDAILAKQPRIVGFGVYIWNLDETTRLVADLKRVRPEIVVVLGGPEVSYETEDLPIIQLADHVIAGEADQAFAKFCREKLTELNDVHRDVVTSNMPGHQELLQAPLPVLADLVLPYEIYSDEDILQRVIYVEASRGCPFTCEFCLSALEIPVRQFPLEAFLAAMDSLIERGARQFKFVDRTFNLNLRVGKAILEFFLERYQPGLFLHFEMIPDRLPESLKELIVRFPAGALQFEVGIQTFNEHVCELISRHQDNDLAEQNLRWLRSETGVHVHADLIVGLPGESLESFAAGFDRLVRLNPHEIQVGILKRLRGTRIIRHDAEWQMVYSPHPHYEILSNKLLDYFAIQELRRFAKFWDVLGNSGNFVETLPRFWTPSRDDSADSSDSASSPFHAMRSVSNWLFEQEEKVHGIPLGRLVELILQYGVQMRKLPIADIAGSLWRDYQRGGRSDKPHCLRPYINEMPTIKNRQGDTEGPKRQARHRSN